MGSMTGAPGARPAPSYRRIIAGDRVAAGALLFLCVLPFAWWSDRSSKAATLATLVMAAVAGAILWFRIQSIASLHRTGTEIMGRIISLDWRQSFWHDRYSRWYTDTPDYALVTVRYVFSGREYMVNRTVPRRAAAELTAGADVVLLVDPKRPGRFVFEHLS